MNNRSATGALSAMWFGFALLAIPAVSTAADWVMVGQTKGGDYWQLDVESVVQKTGYVQGWIEQSIYKSKDKKPHVEKWLYRFNCEEQTMGAVSYIEYSDLSGNDIANSKSTAYPSMEPVAPETIGESTLKLACGVAAGDPSATQQIEADHQADAAAQAALDEMAAEAAAKQKAKDNAALDAAEKAAGLKKKRGK